MPKAHALLRAGFPYVKTIGMRRVTTNPYDMAIDGNKCLYVICRNDQLQEVRRIAWDDEDLGLIGGAGTGDGRFLWPSCITMAGADNLLVSDEGLHRISRFHTDGTFLGQWGEHGSGDGQLNRPSGIALDPEGNLCVADTLNHRVQKFTADGKFLHKWGTHGSGEGEFNMPWGLTVDDDGEVYVADWRNDRVQKFDAAGKFLGLFGASGSADGQFNRPSGVAVDMHGDVYVADWGNNRVQLFAPDGRYVEKFLGDSSLSKGAKAYLLANPKPLRLREMTCLEPQKRFHGPLSVKVDADGYLYVADCGPHRIQVYQKDALALTPEEILPPQNAPAFTIS